MRVRIPEDELRFLLIGTQCVPRHFDCDTRWGLLLAIPAEGGSSKYTAVDDDGNLHYVAHTDVGYVLTAHPGPSEEADMARLFEAWDDGNACPGSPESIARLVMERVERFRQLALTT